MVAHTLAESQGVWAVIERLAARATAARADLLVLPECTYPAYWLESLERYRELRQGGGPDSARPDRLLDTQEILAHFGAIARANRFWLFGGFVEEEGGRLFNSAALIDRAGRCVGVARKCFLWDCDNRWFSPAEGLSVFDTELGRMGVMICADGRAPEIAATLAAQGAELIVMPTAWVNAANGTGRFENPQADFLIRARAREFAVPFVCADKCGREAGAMEYVGQSQIVDAAGAAVAKAPIEGEHLVVGEVTPRRATPASMTEHQRAILAGDPFVIPASDEVEISMEEGATASLIANQVKRAGGRCAELSGGDLHSYVPARCAALTGAQILVVNGAERDELYPRARAMENRVFVVVLDGAGLSLVVAPTGQVLWNRHRGDRAIKPGISLNLAHADNKCVTRETNIWRQRRVNCYVF